MAIEFHTGIADKLAYACRLLRKAHRQGAKVVVTGDARQLDRLDQALWTFEPNSFVPHARLKRGQSPEPRLLAATPIWFADAAQAAPHRDVLVNVGPQTVEEHGQFTRTIELVSADPDDHAAGQARWRHYKQQGVDIVHALKA